MQWIHWPASTCRLHVATGMYVALSETPSIRATPLMRALLQGQVYKTNEMRHYAWSQPHTEVYKFASEMRGTPPLIRTLVKVVPSARVFTVMFSLACIPGSQMVI